MTAMEEQPSNNPVRSLGIDRPYTPGIHVLISEGLGGVSVIVSKTADSGSDRRRQRLLNFYIRDSVDQADDRSTLAVIRMVGRHLSQAE